MLGLAMLAFAAMGLVLVFNSSQATNTKQPLSNTADAAAYSAATYRARVLNYIAYSNRAIIANEVAAAQAVTLASWAQHVETTAKSVDDLANQLVSIAMSKMKNQESHRGGRGGSIQAQGTSNTSDFCKYCGYVGHEKLKCNIRKKDEAKGIFLPQSPYFSPGRVGRGKGGRGGRGGQSLRGRVHEMGASGGQLTSNPEVTQWQQNGPPNMPSAHFQEPPQMSGQLQPPTFYNAQGGAAALCDQGAFRFFPTQGNQ